MHFSLKLNIAMIFPSTPPYKPARGSPIELVIRELETRIRTLEERMLILEPSPESLAKYPALASAFSDYKLIEALTVGKEIHEASK
jgi:hypothetical protein